MPLHLSPNAVAFLNGLFCNGPSPDDVMDQVDDAPAAVREIGKVTGEALRRSGRPFAPPRPPRGHNGQPPHDPNGPYRIVGGGAGI